MEDKAPVDRKRLQGSASDLERVCLFVDGRRRLDLGVKVCQITPSLDYLDGDKPARNKGHFMDEGIAAIIVGRAGERRPWVKRET
jgi:hypothetical protein